MMTTAKRQAAAQIVKDLLCGPEAEDPDPKAI